MNYNRFIKTLLPCAAMAGAVVLASCTDNDYDFDQIDATVGFGGDGLTLPVNSTDTIKLADVLELDGNDCVVEEPNGDYVFRQTGDPVAPVNPEIGRITVSGSSDEGVIELHVASSPAGYEVTASGEAQTFRYSGDKPAEVKSISYAGVTGRMNLVVDFPRELVSAVSSLDEMTITLPEYMRLGSVTSSTPCTLNGSRLVFAGVPTDRSLTVNAELTGLDVTAGNGSNDITLDDAAGKINMTGSVLIDVKAHVNGSAAANVEGARINSSMDMGNVVIDNAQGRFSPEITLNDLGRVEITGVPDFLDDDEVYVDLYNPVIKLTVTNDMAIGGVIDGTITPYKDGVANTAKSIELRNIPINASATSGVPVTTDVYICRNSAAFNAPAGAVVMEEPRLSDIINPIPDEITFTAEARANDNVDGFFELGKSYSVQPAYSFEAPIAFGENASIVYKDTLDGWNEDINDFDLSEDASIEFSTTIENCVPAYLDLSVSAIDVDGNEMPESEIGVAVSTTVLASGNGETPAETPLQVVLTEGTEGAMKRLDGLIFRIDARSYEDGQSTIVGQTLNARRHFLIARDITVKLVGKIIGDFN